LVAFLAFSGLTTDKNAWFGQATLTGSSWTDLAAGAPDFFSVAGDVGNGRSWFVSGSSGACANDTGWFVVSGNSGATPKPCAWDQAPGADTRIIFSNQPTLTNWNTGGNVSVADSMIVFVR
jgi:hypothetical protein